MANKFKGEDFECLVENTEKYISFSVPIKKERNEVTDETITYKIKFIDSFKFMPTSLSNLVDNLSEIHNKDKKLELDELIKKFPHTMVILINLYCYCEKVFILMDIWIVGKTLIKLFCLLKKIFTVN